MTLYGFMDPKSVSTDLPAVKPALRLPDLNQDILNIIYKLQRPEDAKALSLTNRFFRDNMLVNSPVYQARFLLLTFFKIFERKDNNLIGFSGDTIKPLLSGLGRTLPTLLKELPSPESKLTMLETFVEQLSKAYFSGLSEDDLLSKDDTRLLGAAMSRLSEVWPIMREASDTLSLEGYLEELGRLALKHADPSFEDQMGDTNFKFIAMTNNAERRRSQFSVEETFSIQDANETITSWNSSHRESLDEDEARLDIRGVARVASIVWILDDPIRQEKSYHDLLNLYLKSPVELRDCIDIKLLLAGLSGINNPKVWSHFFHEIKNRALLTLPDEELARGTSYLLGAPQVLERLTSDSQIKLLDDLQHTVFSTSRENKCVYVEGFAQALRIFKDQENHDPEGQEHLKRFDNLFNLTLDLEDDILDETSSEAEAPFHSVLASEGFAKMYALSTLAKALYRIDDPEKRTERFKRIADEAFKVIRILPQRWFFIERFAVGLGALTGTVEGNETLTAHEHRLRWIKRFKEAARKDVNSLKNRAEPESIVTHASTTEEQHGIAEDPGEGFDLTLFRHNPTVENEELQAALDYQIHCYNMMMTDFTSTVWYIDDVNERLTFVADIKKASKALDPPIDTTKEENDRRQQKLQEYRQQHYNRVIEQLAHTVPSLALELWISYAIDLYPGKTKIEPEALQTLKELQDRQSLIFETTHRLQPMVSGKSYKHSCR
jgi:hypothetical protein